MFTGIVEAVGRIVRTRPFEVEAGRLRLTGLKRGDSVCVQGVCLTLTAKRGRRLRFDVSRATLRVSAGLERPGPVNLERALRLGDSLGGHLVAGHVDGVGEVLALAPAGRSKLLKVRVPAGLAKYLARKGSVTVDGVSLTVNRVAGRAFEANLVPHTLKATTLGRLARGAQVNLEVDLAARYLERLAAAAGAAAAARSRSATPGARRRSRSRRR